MWKKCTSIKTKLTIMISLIITVAFVACTLASIFSFTINKRTDAQQYLDTEVSGVTGDLRELIDSIEYISTMPYYSDVTDILATYHNKPSSFIASKDRKVIIHMLQFVTESKPYIVNAYIPMTNGMLFTRGLQGDESHWSEEENGWLTSCDDSGVLNIVPRHRVSFMQDDEVISFVRMLKDNRTHSNLGWFVIDIGIDKFNMCVSSEPMYNEQIYIYDDSNTILYPYHTDQKMNELIDLHIANEDRQHLVSTCDIGRLNLHAVGLLPVDSFTDDSVRLLRQLILVFFVVLSISLIVVIAFSGSFVKPINNLRNAMDCLIHSNFDNRVITSGNDELSALGQGFNWMAGQMKQMIADINQANANEKKILLSLLQRQIGPHFIYNSLESMNLLALAEKQYDLSSGIVALSRLMRQATGDTDETTCLTDELQLVDDYICIESLTTGMRVTLERDLDFSHECLLVPKFILQPLVENTFKHNPERQSVRVKITSKVSEDLLLLTIFNDGDTISTERIEEIQALLNRGTIGGLDEKRKHGIALSNIHMRIQLLYGACYGLSFPTQPPEGFEIEVRLPVIWPKDADTPCSDL